MPKNDYYDVLGVSRDSDSATIKSSYRKLAMKYHPDKNQGDQEAETKFKEISEAYEVLSNPEKKKLMILTDMMPFHKLVEGSPKVLVVALEIFPIYLKTSLVI